MAVEKLNKDLSSQLNITEDEDKLIIALDFGTTVSLPMDEVPFLTY